MSAGIRRNNDEVVENAAAINTVANNTQLTSEGSAWFWRMFGGTIIGGMLLLSATLFNHLNGTISSLRTDILATQRENTGLREKLAGVESSLNTAVEQSTVLGNERKLTVDQTLKTIQEKTTELQTKVTALEQGKELEKERKTAIDEAIKSLQTDLKELHKSFNDFRERQADKVVPPPVNQPESSVSKDDIAR